MKVLIVEEDRDVCQKLVNALEGSGHEVEAAATAKYAENKVKAGTEFDFVFLCSDMPDNDAVSFLKGVSMPRNTKVIVMTDNVDHKLIRSIFNNGASGYLVKPFSEEEVIRHLSFHSSRYSKLP